MNNAYQQISRPFEAKIQELRTSLQDSYSILESLTISLAEKKDVLTDASNLKHQLIFKVSELNESISTETSNTWKLRFEQDLMLANESLVNAESKESMSKDIAIGELYILEPSSAKTSPADPDNNST